MGIELEPTIILDAADRDQDTVGSHVADDSSRSSRVRVESQGDSGERFQQLFDESTRRLLRGRLLLAMVILASMMLVAQVLNFFAGTAAAATLTSRMTAAGVLLGSAIYLWRRPQITLTKLRWIEFVVVVAPLAEVTLMQYLETSRLIENGTPHSVPALMAALGAVVGLFIATYAMFIPSSWRRTAVVAFTYATVPTVQTDIQFATMPGLQDVEYPRFATPFVLFSTAIIATVAAHFVRSIRREVESARQYGQYHLTTEIGRGGMGVVYRAEHRMLKRPAAIKLIRAECASNENAIARFEQEVQLSATLSHWNTVQIYDYGRTEGGNFFYVMEYLEGETLAQRLKRNGPLELEAAVTVVKQICDGLEEAHAKTLVHRDLKPANIFLTDCGTQCNVVKILDFGLATSQASPLQERSVSGSPAYMSPEQIRGEKVDGRSDVYALGCILYECLTGRPLFSGETVSEVFEKHLNGHPDFETGPGLPGALHSIIAKCVAPSATDRFQDVASLRATLTGNASFRDETPGSRQTPHWQSKEGSTDS